MCLLFLVAGVPITGTIIATVLVCTFYTSLVRLLVPFPSLFTSSIFIVTGYYEKLPSKKIGLVFIKIKMEG